MTKRSRHTESQPEGSSGETTVKLESGEVKSAFTGEGACAKEQRKDVGLMNKATKEKWNVSEEMKDDCKTFLHDVVREAQTDISQEGKKIGIAAANAITKMTSQDQGAPIIAIQNNVEVPGLESMSDEEQWEAYQVIMKRLEESGE